MKKTALEKAQELLLSAEGDFKQKGEAAVGWAVLSLAEQTGRVASSLDEVATKLHSLVGEITENKQTKDAKKRLDIE